MTSSKSPIDRLKEMEETPREEGGGWYCHKPVNHYKKFVYAWFHVPTGKHGETDVWCQSLTDFNKILCHWNGYQSGGDWIYSPITSG